MFIPIRPVALTKKFRLPDCPFGSLNLRIFSETDGCYFFNSCCGRRSSLLWRYTYIYMNASCLSVWKAPKMALCYKL